MSDQTQSRTRIITLTDQPPVRIVEADWPTVASAWADSWSGLPDRALHDQARRRGELDEYYLRVRQHADGRSIVYARLDAAHHTDTEDIRTGELLEAGEDLVAAIRRVGQDAGLPDSVIRECVAGLPPEDI